MGAQIGHGVKVSRKVKVLGARYLTIESGSAIAHSVVLDARGQLVIRSGALIGFESVLLTYTHAWPDPTRPVHTQGVSSAPVEIGALSWLGARSFVLPGVTVGDSSVVGAGSVVTKSIPPMKVSAGVPARVVSDRTSRREQTGE
nr:acyltransferase [Diaminobutyricimonas sp. LJ205]